MNEFVVYILQSQSADKIYTGFTSDLINRMQSHNYFSTKGYTLRYRPWVVIYQEFFPDKTSALKREKFLKSGAGRTFLHENVLKPDSANNFYS